MAIDKINTAGLGDSAVTASKLDSAAVSPTAVSDTSNTSTGGLSLPTGTTAQRPSSPDTGESRMNTTTGSLEFYDGTTWVSTNLIPTISSITGELNNAYASSLVFAITGNTDSVDVVFSEGGSSFHTVQGQIVSAGAFTLATPSQVYGQTAGDTITIKIINADGTPSSNAITKTVLTAPTGGTITTSGGKRYHAFTSTDNFVIASGWPSTTVEYVAIAGGGGGSGDLAGGGGAGGHVTGTFTATTNTYVATVGGGGAGGPAVRGTTGSGVDGNNSRINGIGTAAVGGGTSGHYNDGGATAGVGHAGGSGGGGGGSSSARAGGAGTAGQGNDGGVSSGPNNFAGGGGGGAGAVGGDATGVIAGDGGIGTTTYNAWGAATSTGVNSGGTRYYAGGGGGGTYSNVTTASADGGIGGGGVGWGSSRVSSAGAVNTGGGGGGGGYDVTAVQTAGAAGGSGIVILRYTM